MAGKGVRGVSAKEQEEGVRAQILMSFAMSTYPVHVTHANVSDRGQPAILVEEVGLDDEDGGSYLVTIRKVGNVRLGAV